MEAVAQCTMQHHDLHARPQARIASLQTRVPEPSAAARDVSVRQMIETAAICSLRAGRLLRSLGAPPPARTGRCAWVLGLLSDPALLVRLPMRARDPFTPAWPGLTQAPRRAPPRAACVR